MLMSMHRWILPGIMYTQLTATWPANAAHSDFIPLSGNIEFNNSNHCLIFHPATSTGMETTVFDPGTCIVAVAPPLILLYARGSGVHEAILLEVWGPDATYDVCFCRYIESQSCGERLHQDVQNNVAVQMVCERLKHLQSSRGLCTKHLCSRILSNLAQWAPHVDLPAAYALLKDDVVKVWSDAPDSFDANLFEPISAPSLPLQGEDVQLLVISKVAILYCICSVQGLAVTHIFAYDRKVWSSQMLQSQLVQLTLNLACNTLFSGSNARSCA